MGLGYLQCDVHMSTVSGGGGVFTCLVAAAGEALLFLMPSEEEGMLKALEEKKIPIKLRSFSARKVLPMKGQFGALLAEHEGLKLTAQAAFLTYMRSVYLNPRRDIFDPSKLDADAYAASMGMLAAPHQRAVKKMRKYSQQATKGSRNAVAKGPVAVAGGSGWQSLPYEEAEEDQNPDEMQGGLLENHEQADLDASGSDIEPEGDGRSNGATGLTVEESDAEEGEEGGDILKVRRRDVLVHLPDIEADGTRARCCFAFLHMDFMQNSEYACAVEAATRAN